MGMDFESYRMFTFIKGVLMSKEHIAKLVLETTLELPKNTGKFSIDIYNEKGDTMRGTLHFGQGGISWQPKIKKYRISWTDLANILDNQFNLK